MGLLRLFKQTLAVPSPKDGGRCTYRALLHFPCCQAQSVGTEDPVPKAVNTVLRTVISLSIRRCLVNRFLARAGSKRPKRLASQYSYLHT